MEHSEKKNPTIKKRKYPQLIIEDEPKEKITKKVLNTKISQIIIEEDESEEELEIEKKKKKEKKTKRKNLKLKGPTTIKRKLIIEDE
jgi:deoxycytidylate deaminase